MITCDRRCSRCADSGRTAVYRMIGRCTNCGTDPILGLFTPTHDASGGACPVCGCDRLVWNRLATEDEIPADASEAGL